MVAVKRQNAAMSRDLRQRILTCMNKLTDKDTHSQAVSELESLLPTLTPDTLPLFLTSLTSTTTSAPRAATRASSLHLLSSLSSLHGPSLSPHLPKLLLLLLPLLRDPDSLVRHLTAPTTSSIVLSLSSTSSFNSILRHLSESLATEQDPPAQLAAANCIAAAIDAAPKGVDFNIILKYVPKWMKLGRREGYRGKAGVAGVMRSVVRCCGGVGSAGLLREMVGCFGELLKSEDWGVRKAAAEVLFEIAVVERNGLSEFKAGCLKSFEARRFDKVKGVREAMNQMVEAWKEVPDVFDDGSPPPQSQTSSRENASDGRFPARSKISSAVGSNTPQTTRKHGPVRRSSPSDSALKTTARTRGVPVITGKRSSLPVFRKLDPKKPSDHRNGDATDLHGSSVTPGYEDIPIGDDDGDVRRASVRQSKPETKRGLFSKNSGSRVVPYLDDGFEATAAVSNASADVCRHQKDSEDLSLIRKQLVQIETQQSSLMDLLQKFIGSSQDGMRTLETRVHGLERALDDISYDLAVSTARMSNAEPPRTSCCLLPGSDFLSSKFWRRPGGHCSMSRFSFSGGTPSVSAMRSIAEQSPGNTAGLENRRFRLRGPGGVIMNPLAEIPGDSRGYPEASSTRVLRSVRTVA